MTDVFISKYLETQLALAKQKQDTKCSKQKSVTSKSKTVADKISKKQGKYLYKSKLKESEKDICYNSRTSTERLDGGILPLEKEEESTNFEPKCSRTKLNLAKASKKKVKPLLRSSKESDNDECTTSNSGQEPSDMNDTDEEYLPSEVEDEGETYHFSVASSSRTKAKLNKIIDDGDINTYNDRIKVWKANVAAAALGKDIKGTLSADIQYIMEGKKGFNKNHELQNGFCVPNYIWKQLYKYQRVGVKWLWELHQVESGGLLGDEMGLGKTVQIIAFLSGLCKTNSGCWGGLGPSIIVAPATVIYQWVSHFHFWYPEHRVAVLHHSGSHSGGHNKLIRDLHSSHGILLITYAGIVKYHKELIPRKWHYIILDEGHKIRNPDTQVSKLIKQFNTPHKILITGSPMQNSLQELWSLFDFMRPGLLGSHAAFMEHFALPITQGGYANATEYQEATALEIAKALKNIITPYMLRRTKAEVQEHIHLPEKNEQVLFCALSKEQRDLYMGYLMSGTVRSILDKENKYGDPLRARVLVALSTLRKICNHPDLYLYEAQEETEEIDEETFGNFKRAGKMSVVNSLLKIWQKQGHRCLIFSQSRAMLCLLENYLQQQNFKYLKMDGTVNVGQRQNLIKTFNEDSDYLVFLSTTRVGGLGVNLTGADRVIIYDPDWNPATDNQAKERAWRIGQHRNVTVYRLLSAGTIEEKIYQRQIFKNFLSNKILIDPNQKNVLTTSTLQGLFTLEDLNCDGDTETASLFKHTKVNITKKKDTAELSYSKKKLELMKKMAKEISNKIKKDFQKQSEVPEEDPREKYKKKREQDLLNPKVVEEPEVNIVHDQVTTTSFENALSEIDIVNQHVKHDYEENLLKEVLDNQENQVTEEEPQTDTIINEEAKNDLNANEGNNLKSKNKSENSRKRKHSESETEIDNVVAVKKVKKKKKEKTKELNDDDYVLSKLFAKSTVKNALHHDVVVGLAEKEKKLKMKEEAERRAKKAIRAIRFCTLD
ncbi:LOW QUALITY PROTEIN: DNA excision repair protein ERCC-6-like [Aricia agestis]|uniref:LOW QUALITY PROTEIN: DNA excision repair protein ERCC-6-like n=1 Tax=Aricia agestis TaxID=91739 RepID=UPI001C20AE25|nr:LOW QUALITY PROTEIN: DNA excision repair protein ERCC-6-like [Aricia agestis]